MFSYLLLFILGIAGGFLITSVGLGVSMLSIALFPIFLLKMGVLPCQIPQYTIANAMFSVCLSAFLATWSFIKQRRFYKNEIIKIGIMAVSTSLLVSQTIVHTPWYSIGYFNVIIILVMLYMLYGIVKNLNTDLKQPTASNPLTQYFLVGLIGGALSSLSGLGTGILIIPALHVWFHMDMKKAQVISIGVTFLTSLGITLVNFFKAPVYGQVPYSFGYIVFPLIIPVSLGILLGIPLGIKVNKIISSKVISIIFSIFIVLMIITKLLELIKSF